MQCWSTEPPKKDSSPHVCLFPDVKFRHKWTSEKSVKVDAGTSRTSGEESGEFASPESSDGAEDAQHISSETERR